MKIFLSALENGETCQSPKRPLAEYMVENGVKLRWNLMSFYYIGKKFNLAQYIKKHSEEVLIDSGAHSFQKGKKVNWEEYTEKYCDFIKRFDDEKVLGFFEMDVDNIIGYENVLRLRKRLERVSNKIIPVWHKNRGIEDFKKMCQCYSGKIVAITGFKNEDIKDEQYISFLKYAKSCGCKVHCLGMTRKRILDVVPFDYADSSTWKQHGIFGVIPGKGNVSQSCSKENREAVFRENYILASKMQQDYYRKWKKVCQD